MQSILCLRCATLLELEKLDAQLRLPAACQQLMTHAHSTCDALTALSLQRKHPAFQDLLLTSCGWVNFRAVNTLPALCDPSRAREVSCAIASSRGLPIGMTMHTAHATHLLHSLFKGSTRLSRALCIVLVHLLYELHPSPEKETVASHADCCG